MRPVLSTAALNVDLPVPSATLSELSTALRVRAWWGVQGV
jgi:hypothetical protein